MNIARELDVRVLAEGIENEAELGVLRAAGINLFQGYYFAKPGFMTLPQVAFIAEKPIEAALAAR